jgi:GAF domain-containing protein
LVKDDLSFLSISDYAHWSEKPSLYAKTERFGAVLVISLKWQNRIVGVLYINDKPGREYPAESAQLLGLFANTAAIAIDNAHLLHEAQTARQRIHSAYEASNALAFPPDSGEVLQDIANQALAAADAAWIRLIIFDGVDNRRNFVASRKHKPLNTEDKIRPDGISMRVFMTGKPYRIEDVNKERLSLNPAMIEEGSQAALCLPLSRRGRGIGVMWIHYEETRKFSRLDLDALSIYVKQASIAYDNARQMEELEPLRVAAEGLAAASGTSEVLERIVASARQILQADAAAVWHCAGNEPLDKLLIQDATVSGIDEEVLKALTVTAIPVGDITNHVLQDGWYGISDIERHSPGMFSEPTKALLQQIGAKSFQGLALVVGEERLGILYLMNKNQRRLRVEETHTARTFAAHAALALKKAKLVDEVKKAQIAAQQVAKLTVLGDLKETLLSVVKGTKDVLRCDAVTLFIYNEATGSLDPLTTMLGVIHERDARHCQDAPRSSIVYKMLFQDKPYCVPRIAENSLFRGQRFAEREQIESVCAIPMKVGEHRVGVMFVNYREFHSFTEDEINSIVLFGNQAAVAIRNARLFEEQNKRLIQQQALANLSRELLGASDLREILGLAVRNATDSLGTDFGAIVLPDWDDNLRIAAACRWDASDIEAYDRGSGSQFQTDYTIQHEGPVFVHDYNAEDRFELPEIVTKKGIKSGLSVPMFSGDKIVGAMLVHSLSLRLFSAAEARVLSVIANLTAIAIQQHLAVESKIASLEAVTRATNEISRIRLGVGQKEVLNKLVEQAVKCLPQTFLGTIQLYDEKKNELRFESIYPSEIQDSLIEKLGERRSLVRCPDKRIGIAGRVILTKEAQLIDDVSTDPDYFKFTDRTKSELAVPLLTEDNEVLGVLNVESDKIAIFDEDDKQVLMALAKLAVTTIQNAEQYDLLKDTQVQVESSTLLAWFGMASSVWGHSVAGDAINIRDNVMLLRMGLNKYPLEDDLRKLLEDKLQVVDDMARQIREKPITALLSYSEGLSDVNVNALIRKRITQLWRNARYKAIPHRLQLSEVEPIVHCSPEWIKRMLEFLIDNAIDAMKGHPNPLITVGTRMLDEAVEITVADTGPGIPRELASKLFKQRIEKLPNSKGLGTGLLIAQAIARTYKGEVGVSETSPRGTTVHVRLPVVNQKLDA